MLQIQLPIFPSNSTAITNELAFQEREGTVWDFNGHLPVFSHPVDDIGSFRFFTSQLIANGNASQSEISRAFGVPLVSVKRACKKLKEEEDRRDVFAFGVRAAEGADSRIGGRGNGGYQQGVIST